MLEEIFSNDRWLRIAHTKLKNSIYYKPEIVAKIDFFLDAYAGFYGLSVNEVIQIYNVFTKAYSEDIREFLKTGKYPFEYKTVSEVPRIDYDIVLILSVVLSIHRHRIFTDLMAVSTQIEGQILLIGVGSGLEIEFLNKERNKIIAYDISISKFVQSHYNTIELKEKYFSGGDGDCDNIFAIELLEHLPDPMGFIQMIYRSLRPGGHFFFTTATNIPQADHLFNFVDIAAFEADVKQMGYRILQNNQINHESIDAKLEASNNWFALTK